MAKPKRALFELLKLLDNKKVMTRGEIVAALHISRKTRWETCNEAEDKGLIEKDVFNRYTLTTLGKSLIDSPEMLQNSNYAYFAVFTQVLDPVIRAADRPPTWCRLYMNDAKKIKQLDDQSSSYDRYLPTTEGFGLEENATNIKAPAAALVDAILELKAKDIGLLSILDFESRDTLSISNIEDRPPGHDDLKRRRELANTNFKLLIEFDGRDWAKKQKYEDLISNLEGNLNFYRKSAESKRAKNFIDKIDFMFRMLARSSSSRDTFKESNLFKNKGELLDYLYELFVEKYQIGDKLKLREVIKKAYNYGLLEVSKKEFISIKVNKEKIWEFHRSLEIN
jgi:predicted transcriptional regulator